MTSRLHALQPALKKKHPDLKAGYTVRVHEKVQEGEKERLQVFEGLVIAVHKGMTSADASFTVRKIASGIGVERVYALHSPLIEKIDVKRVANVRRAKLYFLRGRSGKSARLSERFTKGEEFAVAVQPEDGEAPEVPNTEIAEPKA
ncbi:MAG: 50S ribosomal protein L19 [Candidatus Peregrinibacteria bacterium]